MYTRYILNIHMKDAVINFKTDQKLKRQAQKKADKLGIPLSAALNSMLRTFTRAKEIEFVLDEHPQGPLVPGKRLKQAIKEAEEDLQHGRTVSFTDFDEEIGWLQGKIAKTENRDRTSKKN